MTILLDSYKTFEKDGKLFLSVCDSDKIYEGKGVKIQFPEDEDFQVAILRVNGKLYCLDNICPHRHADRIYEGIIKNDTVMCPLHGWTYSVITGENQNKHQGLKNLRVFDVYEENGVVFIEKPEFKIPKWRSF